MALMKPGEFQALMRQDLLMFGERVFHELNPSTDYAENFHIAVIAAALERVRRGECKRLIINVPPRSMKSIMVSVAFVAFLQGHDPTTEIISATYGQELSDALARQCRQVMQSEWYRQLFPKTRLSRSAVHDFATTRGGRRIATSVTGAITGFGADIVLIDDPVKPDQALSDVERKKANDWFSHSLVSRLNNKSSGAIVIVMQRLHEDDLVGHVVTLDDWEVVSFPAIAQDDEVHIIETPYGSYTHRRAGGEPLDPLREPLEVLEGLRRTMGAELFAAQYLQSPAPPGGGMIRPAWFPRFDLQDPPKFNQIVQSWDTANKVSKRADYSVCTTWGIKGEHAYLLSVLRAQLEYPELKQAIISQANLWKPGRVLIEDNASGTQLIQELRGQSLYQVKGYKPTASKEVRARAQTPRMENGFVHLPEQAHWLADLLHEFLMFPNGRHDDQVDSVSQALEWLAIEGAEPAFLTYMRLEAERSMQAEIPSVRIRHVNPAMAVQTITGRLLPPPLDGIFVLTAQEAAPLLGAWGFSRVD
jgi:predicted phage terminase large subunit-like protein